MTTAVRRWIGRYLPAEAASVLAALAAASLAWRLTANWEAAALAGNWAELGAFVLVMGVREFASLHGRPGLLAALSIVLRNLTMEFALAEAIDTLITRPVFMDVAERVTGDLTVGICIGKLAADITFYAPTIVSYEFRRRYLDAPLRSTGRTAAAPAGDLPYAAA